MKIRDLFFDPHKLDYGEVDFRKPIDNLIEPVWEPSREENKDWMFVLCVFMTLA